MSEFRRRCLLHAMKYGKGDMVIEVSKPTTFTITENGVERIVALSTGINRLPHLDKVDTFKFADKDALLSFDGGGLEILNCENLFDSFKNVTSIKNVVIKSNISSYVFRGCDKLKYISTIYSLSTHSWATFMSCKSLEVIQAVGYQPKTFRMIDVRYSPVTKECLDYIYDHIDKEVVNQPEKFSAIWLRHDRYEELATIAYQKKWMRYGVQLWDAAKKSDENSEYCNKLFNDGIIKP